MWYMVEDKSHTKYLQVGDKVKSIINKEYTVEFLNNARDNAILLDQDRKTLFNVKSHHSIKNALLVDSSYSDTPTTRSHKHNEFCGIIFDEGKLRLKVRDEKLTCLKAGDKVYPVNDAVYGAEHIVAFIGPEGALFTTCDNKTHRWENDEAGCLSNATYK